MIEFDSVLRRFGKKAYAKQLVFTLLVYWNALPFGMHTLAPVMYAAPTNYRCNVSLDSIPVIADNFTEEGVVNRSSKGVQLEYGKCERLKFNTTCAINDVSCNVTVNKVACDVGYWFDRSIFENTVVMEWSLVCDKRIMISVATSAYMAGMWLGSILFGYLSDRYGRRPSMVASVIGATAASLSLNLSTNIWIFLLLRFLVGVFCYPAFMISFIYALEINYKRRTLAGLLIHVPFALGHAMNSVIAYLCRDWRTFNIVISVFFLPYIIFHFMVSAMASLLHSRPPGKSRKRDQQRNLSTRHRVFSIVFRGFESLFLQIPESPRWYFSNGRVEEGKKSSWRFVGDSKCEEEERRGLWDETDSSVTNAKCRIYSSLDLFKSVRMRMITVKVILTWFSTSLVFYGLSLNVGSLNGDIFVNNALNAGVEILISAIVISTLDRIGRRILLASTLLVAGVSCVVNAVLNSTIQTDISRLIISLLGKIGAAGAFQVLYNFTAELYPTVLRSNAVGVGSMAARIGSICTPFVVRLYDVTAYLPDIIFGSVAMVAGGLVLTLPETTNLALPQTINEAEAMYDGTKEYDKRDHEASI